MPKIFGNTYKIRLCVYLLPRFFLGNNFGNISKPFIYKPLSYTLLFCYLVTKVYRDRDKIDMTI
nr:MAG TPA: hypothetical protein [Bacteriophage sp.]